MYNDGSNFIIAKHSTKSLSFVFLVDRDITKKKWWTGRLSEAMRFRSEFAAQRQCEKLQYGKPRVCLASEFYTRPMKVGE